MDGFLSRQQPIVALLRFLQSRGQQPEQIERMRTVFGVPVTPLDNLTILAIAEAAPVTASELGTLLGLPPPRVSRQVSRLEDLGLLAREPDPRDGRSMLLALTPAAHTRRAAWRDTWTADYAAPTAEWTPAERDSLAAFLQRLQSELTAYPPFSASDLAALMSKRMSPAPERALRVVIGDFVQWAAVTLTSAAYARYLQEATGSTASRQAAQVLQAIGRREPIDVTELSRTMNLDVSAVSRHCRALTDLSLVEREVDDADGRRSLLRVTSAGNHLLLALDHALTRPVTDALRSWHPAELNDFLGLMDRLVSVLLGSPGPDSC